MVGDKLQNASDIWLTTDLATLRDGEGQLDTEKIGEHVDRVLDDKPHWRKAARADFSSGVRRPIPQPKTIGQAFKDSLIGR